MEVIQNYLNNIFAGYPQTSELQNLKQDMLANMEEKFITLRQSGKSEHEAAYSVIANFGSIEEITAELGLDMEKDDPAAHVFVSSFEAQAYLSKSKTNGLLNGLGIWLILAGVSTVIAFEHVFILFLAVAAAVSLFVICGSRMHAYAHLQETPVRLDEATRRMIENASTQFIPWRTGLIVTGLVCILLTVGAFTAIDFPVPLFLNIVGFSVFLFVIAGSFSSAYDVLLDKGDYAYKLASKQAGRVIGTVSAVYWPVITVIFLCWSFLKDAWDISWVIWPIAGILFGAICAGILTWHRSKGRAARKS